MKPAFIFSLVACAVFCFGGPGVAQEFSLGFTGTDVLVGQAGGSAAGVCSNAY